MATTSRQQAKIEFVSEEGGVVVEIDGVGQSYINLENPTFLAFDYLERIADFLDAIDEPGWRYRTIHVGGAGMSLARYQAATRPTSPQIVLEPNAELTALVREKLPLPPRSGIKVRAQDGRSGLTAMRDDFAKAIVIDAFAGASVPKELATVEFYTICRRVCLPDGVVLVNLIDQRPFNWARRTIAAIAKVFSEVAVVAETRILNQPRFGNLVVAASNVELPIAEVNRMSRRAIFPHRVITNVEHFIAGAKPFYDADSEDSPVGSAAGALRFT